MARFSIYNYSYNFSKTVYNDSVIVKFEKKEKE